MAGKLAWAMIGTRPAALTAVKPPIRTRCQTPHHEGQAVSVFDLLWIVLLAAFVLPLVQRRMLESARRQLRMEIERERGSRVILLVHRQETVSLFGVPLMRYIDIQDAEEVIHAIRQTPDHVPIDLILHTPGGLVLASLQIARAVASHPSPVTALVPHYAMSGGTLIALAADRIVMCEHAALGPIDPQVGPYPAASVIRAVSLKEDRHIDDEILILADQAGMAMEQVRRSVIQLLGKRVKPELAEYIAGELSQGRWTHDYPITAEEAAGLGLSVDTAMPEAVMAMMRLFPQPTRSARSVEYGQRGKSFRPVSAPPAEHAGSPPAAPAEGRPGDPPA